MSIVARTAADIYERDGPPALQAYLVSVENTSGVQANLFDSRGTELSGRVAPAGAAELARRTAAGATPLFVDFTAPQLGAQTVLAPRGASYTMVLAIPIPQPPAPRFFQGGPVRPLLSFAAILLVGGTVCYALARYLSEPLSKLRTATQELANGNLETRVSAKLLQQQDEVGALGRDFNYMAERLATLIAAQQRLLGDISHELRSPLTRLNVALELARRRAGAPAEAAHNRIALEAESLNELIGQLLTLTRTESGLYSLPTSSLDLGALVAEIAADADFEARSRSRSVQVRQERAVLLDGQPDLLQSAIENVVRNGVRYTAAATKVEITVQREVKGTDEYAVISVRDYGPGVPEESLDEIFRPFYRVEDARDRQSGGSGLGLAIAARAVQLHSGTIIAANVAGGGLAVTIKLPCKIPLKGKNGALPFVMKP